MHAGVHVNSSNPTPGTLSQPITPSQTVHQLHLKQHATDRRELDSLRLQLTFKPILTCKSLELYHTSTLRLWCEHARAAPGWTNYSAALDACLWPGRTHQLDALLCQSEPLAGRQHASAFNEKTRCIIIWVPGHSLSILHDLYARSLALHGFMYAIFLRRACTTSSTSCFHCPR